VAHGHRSPPRSDTDPSPGRLDAIDHGGAGAALIQIISETYFGIALRKGRTSFLKKRSKKLLTIARSCPTLRENLSKPKIFKGFWFFFLKKNILPF
jgi:hypothetical protein